MSEVTIGPGGGDHIAIRILRRMYPQADDYWDGNWIEVEVLVDIRPWRAAYRANLRPRNSQGSGASCRRCTTEPGREPPSSRWNSWLALTIELDPLGHITLMGDAGPEGSGRNFGQVHLDFQLDGVMD